MLTDSHCHLNYKGLVEDQAAVIARARAAGVGKYVLFHHDPTRNDAGVVEVERKARELFQPSVAAREGMSITLQPELRAEAA